jgi:Rrf2 family protein
MRMSEGVEWAMHCCLALSWLHDEQPISTAKLAAGYDLPPAYLNKQLQALARAGIVTSTPGVRGGFKLARPLEEITVMDIVAAIEGPDDVFQCTEIRQRGAGASRPEQQFRIPCSVSLAMRKAELAWRRALAAQTLADVRVATDRRAPQAADTLRSWYARG